MGFETAEKQKEQENEDKKEVTIDKQTERNYRFARDEEISEFYYRHFPYEYNMRKDLLSACVKMNDFERATHLIDLMASTKGNPDYEGLNGWGRQNMLTLYYLIEEYAYGKLIQPLYSALVDLKRKYRQVSDRNHDLEGRISRLHDEISDQKAELKMLRSIVQDMELLKKTIGTPAVEKMLNDARSMQRVELMYRKNTKTPVMDR